VLDELGIQLTEDLNKLPVAADTSTAREGQRQPQAAMASASGTSSNDIDADLQSRLENLRRE
jgi:hypothetical protein